MWVTRWCEWIARLKSTLVFFVSLVKLELLADQLVGYSLDFKNLCFLYGKGTIQSSFGPSGHNLRNFCQLTVNCEFIFWDIHGNMFCLNSWWFELATYVIRPVCFKLWYIWLWYWSIFQPVLGYYSLFKRTFDDPINRLKWCSLPVWFFNNFTLVRVWKNSKGWFWIQCFAQELIDQFSIGGLFLFEVWVIQLDWIEGLVMHKSW